MEIIAEKRIALGKQNKQIRKQRRIPAVMYSKGIESINLAINALEFIKVFKQAGETTLLDLNIEGKKEKVLVSEVQVHPVTMEPIHVGFHKVNLKEKIKANVQIEVLNKELNQFVKSGEGMILNLLNEIEVEALPADLPHNFEVDVKDLQLGEGITVGQLNFDKTKVEIVDTDIDDLVVKLDEAKMAEEEAVAPTEEELVASVEATKEKKEDEEEEDKEEKK